MRNASLILAIIAISVFACDRNPAAPKTEEETTTPEITERRDPIRAEIPASDSVPGLAAAPTAIDFWVHPTLPFNSLMVVSSADGIIGYNIEDGAEAVSIENVNAGGVAVSYLGFDRDARGILVYFDEARGAFKLQEIDNVTRSFKAIEGELSVQGDVLGFCLGRGRQQAAPSLYVIQNSRLFSYHLTAENRTVTALAGFNASIPSSVHRCGVDPANGDIILGTNDDQLFRLTPGQENASGIAIAPTSEPGDIASLLISDSEKTSSIIALLDEADGSVHLFDAAMGINKGAVSIAASSETPEIGASTILGASSANLGGLYRNGAIVLSTTEGTESTLHLISVGAVMNALEIPFSDAIDPRVKNRVPLTETGC